MKLNDITLKEVTTIIMGQSPDSSSYNSNGDGVPFFQGNADFGVVTPITRLHCNNPTKMAQLNDVLISVRAPIGAVNIAQQECCIGRGLSAIRSKNGLTYYKYIYYLLKAKAKILDSQGTGSTFKAISKKDLEEINVPHTKLEEQKKIAKTLDMMSELIAKRKEQISLLDELIKSTFIEMFGDPVTNPKGWKKMQLRELCHKITDGKHGGCTIINGTGYYFIGARELYNDKVNYENAPEISEIDFEKDYKRCNIENGDFVIVNTGATIGKSAILNHPFTEKTLLQKSVALIKTKNNVLLPIYVKWCYKLNSEMYYVSGASAQPNLLLSRIKETYINIPPIIIQNQFAEFVTKVETSKAKMQEGYKELDILYKSNMQEYFE